MSKYLTAPETITQRQFWRAVPRRQAKGAALQASGSCRFTYSAVAMKSRSTRERRRNRTTHIEATMLKDHTITRAQREADKAFKKVKAKETMTDYAKAQQSLQDNRERLKAERLAREAKAEAGGK